MRRITIVAAALAALGWASMAAAQTQERWVGVYACDQGVQGVTLTITRLPDDQLSAVFAFYPNPTNPGVGSGSFEMRGHTDADGRAVSLAAQRWIDQPGDYSMVDFIGEVASNRQLLTGTLPSQGVCPAAALVRAP